jgi:hypothetical protein
MTRYNLQLLPSNPDQIGNSREIIKRELWEFGKRYNSEHPGRKYDPNMVSLFEDLRDGRFWGTLALIDGYAQRTEHPSYGPTNRSFENSTKKRQEARIWARKNFSVAELEKILNIAVNTAFLTPFGASGWPGTTRAHSVLYQELVEKEHSMFFGVVDKPLKRRLNNGRFWEELPDMHPGTNGGLSYEIVGDVLEANFHDLDIDFAQKGFELMFRRNSMLRSIAYDSRQLFELHGLNNRAIDLYLNFVRRLDKSRQKIGITKKDISYLVAPYVVELLETRGQNESIPRFNGSSEDFKARLEDPMVRSYLNRPGHVRNVMMETIASTLLYGERTDMARDCLNVLTDKSRFIVDMLAHADPDYRSSIVEAVRDIK